MSSYFHKICVAAEPVFSKNHVIVLMSIMKVLTMSDNSIIYESAYKCEQTVNKLCTN